MSNRDDFLFSKYDLSDVLRATEKKIFEEIDAIEGNRLLNTSVDDLCDYFEQKYKGEVPQLKENEITVDQKEVKRPPYAAGTAVTFFVPFDGDAELFRCRPSTFTVSFPRASISQIELVLTYPCTTHDAAAVKSEFDKDLSEIRQFLEWIKHDVSSFNASLRDKARIRIEARRQKLLKDQNLVASLGFPLKQKDDALRTYVVPTVRRKVVISMPTASTAPFVPEPRLDMQEYEHILSVISNMVAVMERSPNAFCGMKEEDLRQHFLVQLNGQYEGQATGETFNFEGKTDILIRAEGKNIFVAECKFWRGPESLKEALDQLLGYATWRDTKIALLIFNRERQLSSVLTKIPEVIKEHPNLKREVSYGSETGFRFVLHHRDDTNRELILTVLVFEVPT